MTFKNVLIQNNQQGTILKNNKRELREELKVMPQDIKPGKQEVGDEARAETNLQDWLIGRTQPGEADQGPAKVFIDQFVSEISKKTEKVREQAEIVIMHLQNTDSTQGLRDALKVEDVNKLKEAATKLADNLDSRYEGNALTKAQVLQKTRQALEDHKIDAVKVSEEPKGPRI